MLIFGSYLKIITIISLAFNLYQPARAAQDSATKVDYLTDLRIEFKDQLGPKEDPLSQIKLSFISHGKRIIILLKKNFNLLHSNFKIRNSAGSIIDRSTSNSISESVTFRGLVFNPDNKAADTNHHLNRKYDDAKFWNHIEDSEISGYARIMIRFPNNFSPKLKVENLDSSALKFDGYYTLNEQRFSIQSTQNYLLHKRSKMESNELGHSAKQNIIVLRSDNDKEILSQPRCDAAMPTGNISKYITAELSKRSGGFQCIPSRKVLYMGVVADCSYVSMYGGIEAAFDRILAQWNQASAIYERHFNLGLGIQELIMENTCDQSDLKLWNRQCDVNYKLIDRLNHFSLWRRSRSTDIRLWHLLTRCNSGNTVGTAWTGTVCMSEVSQQGQSFISGAAISSASLNEWSTIAHEIGHNMGAIHDCTNADNCDSTRCCACQNCDCNQRYLMNPNSGGTDSDFSPCSVNQICSNRDTWLRCSVDENAGLEIRKGTCGNGIVEEGEECDCGDIEGKDCLNSKCCIPGECKLKPGAQCEDLNGACCRDCQLLSPGTICRKSRGECDYEEKCDGRSGICPKDIFKPDKVNCRISQGVYGKCASGDCTSRDHQCALRGSELGSSGECPGNLNQCGLYCQTSSIFSCVSIENVYFVDGTECGYDGTCRAGVCEQGAGSAFLGFFLEHAGITSILISTIIIFGISIFYHMIQRGKHIKKRVEPEIINPTGSPFMERERPKMQARIVVPVATTVLRKVSNEDMMKEQNLLKKYHKESKDAYGEKQIGNVESNKYSRKKRRNNPNLNVSTDVEEFDTKIEPGGAMSATISTPFSPGISSSMISSRRPKKSNSGSSELRKNTSD